MIWFCRQYGRLTVLAVLLLNATTATAQATFEVMNDFATVTARGPNAGLIVASDGNLYGTTSSGGAHAAGTVFKMTPAGIVTVLYSFAGSDGKYPIAELAEGADGNLYGTTSEGGAANGGTIFKISKAGALTTLHEIAGYDPDRQCFPEGFVLASSLLEGTDGNFYGTVGSGENCSYVPTGISSAFLFRVSPAGEFSLLPKVPHLDGYGAWGGLTRGADGYLYGSTYDAAGDHGVGVMFRITESSTYEVVYDFRLATDGFFSLMPLYPGRDGTLFGATIAGGAKKRGTVYRFDPVARELTTLRSFDVASPSGAPPSGGVILASDGWLYGTTQEGGQFGGGTVYRMDATTGAIEVLHQFTGLEDGFNSRARLIETSPGVFIGTTAGGGGWFSGGVIFKLTVGAANFRVTAIKAPSLSAPGSTISVRDTTKNAGTAAGGPSRTRLWLSANKTIDTTDIVLNERDVPSLGAGIQSIVTQDVTLPNVAPGAYFLIAEADAETAVAESDEGDNLRVKSIKLGPDLTVKAIALAPASPVSTSPTSVTLTIKNNGGGNAGPTVTRLYRSANGKVDASDAVLASAALGAVAAGVTVTQTMMLTLPAGTYNLLAVTDASGAVAEVKETNNLKKAALVVR